MKSSARPAPRPPAPVLTEEEQLFARLDPARLPRHVAIIMDGNGRWARGKSLPDRIHGHRAGVEAVRAATRTSAELGLRALTLYAFSKENWSRPKREITALMALLDHFLVAEIPELTQNNIRLVASGEIDDLPASIRKTLGATIARTASHTGLVLNLALSYGGRDEIIGAVRAAMEMARRGEATPEEMDAARFSGLLHHPELGDPDLLIRTSGELRVSNFLLWQIAYAEFVFLPILWPDFRRVHYLQALAEYQSRDRRFGTAPDSQPRKA